MNLIVLICDNYESRLPRQRMMMMEVFKTVIIEVFNVFGFSISDLMCCDALLMALFSLTQLLICNERNGWFRLSLGCTKPL
jgi:hypothetical protein